MARSIFGADRGGRGVLPRKVRLLPVTLLAISTQFVAACDSVLDLAGLERKSAHQTESVPIRPPKPPPQARTRHPRQANVAEIQGLLNELGYEAGPVDGIAGPRTKAAITKFKADQKLPIDDRISPAFVATLQGAVNNSGAESDEDAAGPPEEPVAIDEADTAGIAVSSKTLPRLNWRNIYDVSDEPYYEVGDNYIYSTGRIETAVQVTEDLVKWVVNDGSRYSATRNFLLPPAVWNDRHGEMVATIETDAANKWPPANPAGIVFTAHVLETHGTPDPQQSWLGKWSCGSEPYGALSVPAGKFEVEKISCKSTGQTGSQLRSRVWYYAPDIRHYVRYEETRNETNADQVSELIAIRPGHSSWTRSARSGFRWAIQKLLVGGRTGDSIGWKVSESSIEFDITITGELQAADNIDCRQYVVVRKKPGNPRIFPALACRDNISGRWKIPGLEKGSVLPEEVLAQRQV